MRFTPKPGPPDPGPGGTVPDVGRRRHRAPGRRPALPAACRPEVLFPRARSPHAVRAARSPGRAADLEPPLRSRPHRGGLRIPPPRPASGHPRPAGPPAPGQRAQPPQYGQPGRSLGSSVGVVGSLAGIRLGGRAHHGECHAQDVGGTGVTRAVPGTQLGGEFLGADRRASQRPGRLTFTQAGAQTTRSRTDGDRLTGIS